MKITSHPKKGFFILSGSYWTETVTEASVVDLMLSIMRLVSRRRQPAVTTTRMAKMVGSSPATILRAAREGKIRGHKTPGGHWRLVPESGIALFGKGAGR